MPQAILVNPPSPPGYTSNKDSMGGFGQLFPAGASPAPPLDMPYLAAALSEADIEVRVLEAGALRWTLDHLCDALEASDPADGDVVIVRTSLPTIDWDLGVCAALRSRSPGIKVVLYGPPVGALLGRITQGSTVDFAIVGEADGPALELLRGVPGKDIAGLVWRDAAGWHRNPERPFQRDLDAMPFPRWDLFPYERYVIPKSATAGRRRFLPMLTSRGCPYGCNYCPYPVGQGLKWRYRSPANVVQELEHLVRDLGVEYVIFRDPLFSANKARVQAICAEIQRRGLRVQWRCETRVDCLDEPTTAMMAQAGCVGVNFGVESTDPQILTNAERKPITDRQFIEAVELFHRHGIATFAFFIVGLPGDTLDTILQTIRFAIRLNASWTQFTTATPFIGTRLHEWAVDRGLIEPERYQLISSHEGSIGNGNLSAREVHVLLRFAQVLQRNFMNRRGIFKNELRRDQPYRSVKRAADLFAGAAARVVFAGGAGVLRLVFRSTARGAATPAHATRDRAA